MLTMILTRTPTQILLLNPLVSMAASDHNKRRNERPWLVTRQLMKFVYLLSALVAQTSSHSQRVFTELVSEATKCVFPNRRFESRTLEEAFMSVVPDLETVEFKVLSRKDGYEIREVKPYVVAETTMPSKYGFDFAGASQSFNVLAGYLFGENTRDVKMGMTTPAFTRRDEVEGEKMDMTTPVDQEKWKMSFVMPSKYGEDLPLPKDSSVTIKKVSQRVMAVAVFPGLITDEEVKSRESTLRDLINKDPVVRVKEGASLEVAQYNPP